ncbi:hypothetical protein ACFQZZ_25710 [Nocardia sp. GCM10030253]|uniref:hypothetical protein n=1 Tax=Nocardia sp. GCM10030253 TaxID=3273404 RepID=UPI003643C3E0
MTDLVTKAQIILLARTLHVPAERLAHLEKLGAEQLHELQERMAGIIFDRNNAIFKRVSALVPIIPLSISLPLVSRVVPPTMAGRAAGAVGVDHPKKAAEAVGMLDVSYAADCAPYMDPRSVGQLADVAPPDPVIRITNELLRRGDYITAGPLLAYATPELIRAVEQGVHDDEALIRSAAYAFSGANVSAILRELLTGPAQRIPRMIATVLAGETDLRLAALSTFARCDEDVIAAVGDILFDVGSTETITDFTTSAIEAGAVPDILTFVGHFSPAALDSLAANPLTADPAAMSALVAGLDDHAEAALWRGLLNLVERTAIDVQHRVAGHLTELAEPTLAALPAIATTAHLWPTLLRVLAAADADTQTRIGEVWSKLPAADRENLERRVRDLSLDTELATLTVTLNT